MRSIHRYLVVLGLFVSTAGWAADSAAAGVPVDEATQAQKDEATRLFLQAKKEFETKPTEQALEGFRASFDVVASPNALLMVGRALAALERPEEAYVVFEETIRLAKLAAVKAPNYAAAAEAAQADLDSLRALVAVVTVAVVGATDDTQMFLDGKPVEREQWGKEMPLRRGNVTLTVTAEGKPEYQHVLAVGTGPSTHTVDLEAFWAPEEAPVVQVQVAERPSQQGEFLGLDKRQWSYVAGGIGAAGVLTYGVFGALNLSKHGKLMDECPDRRCPAGSDHNGDIDAGRRNKHIANAGFTVGLIGLGAGAALFVLSMDSKKDSSTPAAPSTQVGVGPGSVTVRGTF